MNDPHVRTITCVFRSILFANFFNCKQLYNCSSSRDGVLCFNRYLWGISFEVIFGKNKAYNILRF